MDETQRKEVLRNEAQTRRYLERISDANRGTAVRYIEEARVLSENRVMTLRQKAYWLEQLDRETNGKPWGQLTKDDGLQLMKWLQAKSASHNVRARGRQAIGGLLRWLYEQSPPAWVKTIFKDRRQRKTGPLNIISPEELRRLLTCPDLTLRTRTLLSVLYEAGFRARELCALNVGSVIFPSDRLAHVAIPEDAPFCKSGVRVVSLGLSYGLLRQLLKVHPHRYDLDAPLFGSESPKTMGRRLTYGGVYSALKTACKAATVRRIRPHLFRHTRITNLLQAKEPEAHIRKHVGHSPSSRELATYTHLVTADLDRMALDELDRNEQRRLTAIKGQPVQVESEERPLERLARLQMELAETLREALMARAASPDQPRDGRGQFSRGP